MTTFAKKKAGKSSSNSGSSNSGVGLVSRDRLKSKQAVGANNIQNQPPRRANRPSGGRLRQRVNRTDLDINEISNDVIDLVDDRLKPSGSGEKKKPSIRSKYAEIKKGPISARNNDRKISPVGLAGAKYRKRLSPNQKKEDNGPSVSGKKAGRVKPQVNPVRKYNKPWQRPKTAQDKTEERKVGNKQKEQNKATPNKNEQTRKKANEIMANRRKFRPAMIKKSPTNPNPKSKDDSDLRPGVKNAPSIDIEDIEDMEDEEINKDAPEPMPKSADISKPAPMRGMRKLKSHDIRNDPLYIPLSSIDEDFAPRNKKVDFNPPLGSTNETTAEEEKTMEKEKPKGAAKMIGDLKKRRREKVNRSQHIIANLNESNEINLLSQEEPEQDPNEDPVITTGKVDEVEDIRKSYVDNKEEVKLAEFSGSNVSAHELSGFDPDEDDFTSDQYFNMAFNYADENFDADEEGLKTPFAGGALQEIKEDEEIYDEEDIEKRELKDRIKELEADISERWESLIQYKDKETAKKCYHYFKETIPDVDDLG